MDLQLEGRRAIVTGGSRGIGFAIARTLAEEGAAVGICARSASDVEAAVEALREAGATSAGDAVDVSDPDAYKEWLDKTVDDLGGLDVFVANAGAMADQLDETAWKSSYEVDLMHTVRGCEQVVGALRESDAGAIVAVSSASAVLSPLPPEERAYGALKAALVSYTAQLSQALGSDGIRVNSVSPGTINFPGSFWEGIQRQAPDFFDEVKSMVALGRMGTDLDVARAVAFLASPAASFVTGANLRIDGGLIKTVNY